MCLKRPMLINYYEENDLDNDIDLISYVKDKKVYAESRKRELIDQETTKANKSSKHRPFMPRKSYPKENPRESDWYRKYVIDEGKTFRDPTHRDGKLFALRFSHSFDSVVEIVKKISEPDQNFWKDKKDNAGI